MDEIWVGTRNEENKPYVHPGKSDTVNGNKGEHPMNSKEPRLLEQRGKVLGDGDWGEG